MTSYTPVSYDFREVILEKIAASQSGRIFYFNENNVFDSIDGRISKLEEIQSEGYFVTVEQNASIRIDRIITLFGKPGPAYDEYDRYGNVCMECSGGY
jgi:hypothetical protein